MLQTHKYIEEYRTNLHSVENNISSLQRILDQLIDQKSKLQKDINLLDYDYNYERDYL